MAEWTKERRVKREKYAMALCEIMEKQSGEWVSLLTAIDLADYLHRQEVGLSRINEIKCSYNISDSERKRLSRREENAQRRVAEIFDAYGIPVEFSGDRAARQLGQNSVRISRISGIHGMAKAW